MSENIQALGLYARDLADIGTRINKAFVPGSDVDLAAEFVDMMMVENAFSANVTAIRSENETLGSLMDLLA